MKSMTALIIFLAACGGSSPMTIGEACSDTGQIICQRAFECGLITSSERSTCLSQFTTACCTSGGGCDRPVQRTPTEVMNCEVAFENQTCPQVANHTTPPECQ